MIITDRFVMLMLPKTGSTFARRAIRLLYKNRVDNSSFFKKWTIKLKLRKSLVQDVVLPNIKIKGVKKHPDHHCTYSQIPAKYKKRNIVSIVRNPYERLLSAYEFKGWVRDPSIPKELIVEHFPQFPELSLDEFIDISRLTVENELGERSRNLHLGVQSLQFIRMFFRNPDDVLQKIDNNYIDSDEYLNDMPDITFLRQEHLRVELKGFLGGYGFNASELKIIDELGIVNETKNKSKNRNALLTLKAIKYVNSEERLMLKILRQKGIEYKCPKPDFLNI